MSHSHRGSARLARRAAFLSAAASLLLLLCVAPGLTGRAEEAAGAPGKAPLPQPAVAAPAGGAEAAEAPAKHQPETLLEFAVAGGWMMIPLCLTSILWVSFFIERLIVLRRGRVVPPQLATAMRGLLATRPLDRERALSLTAAHPSPAARILRAALERMDLPLEKIEKAVSYVADREIYRLRENLWIFAIISTISPLLGLLGTVIGLVQAFREVAITGLGAGATLAPGIYEALVATVAGLAIAIPSIASYYWLQARVDRYIHEIDGLVVGIVESAELSPAGI
jgi:biopolymer transport protein ExbB